MTYIGFVALLAFIQSVTGILGLSYKEAAREHVRMDLFKNINRTALVTGQGRVFDLTASWDKLQKSLKCCGVNNSSDWYYSHRWPSQEFVPDSCCDPAHFSDIESMNHCGKVANNTLLYQQESIAECHRTTNFQKNPCLSKDQKVKAYSRDEYHRCLVMNEMEARDLRVQPNDRIGDARQDPLDNIL
ncbi:hypothetical protein OESDEN_02865 [Oesophagostomum dentatum]|uniref:Tetraspanin family protein n=1 Tax=Oesophagostomum dentatum TaxID=61180 RepID=A0A0B1TM72_OESDE|nr:hypothetical protein OESDEN_02865 [Oesophagostomum dentatum]